MDIRAREKGLRTDDCEHLSPDVNHGHSRFDPAPDVRTDLPVRLGCLPEIAPHFLVGPVQRPLLLAAGPPGCAAPGGAGGEQKGHTRYFLLMQTFPRTKMPLEKMLDGRNPRRSPSYCQA